MLSNLVQVVFIKVTVHSQDWFYICSKMKLDLNFFWTVDQLHILVSYHCLGSSLCCSWQKKDQWFTLSLGGLSTLRHWWSPFSRVDVLGAKHAFITAISVQALLLSLNSHQNVAVTGLTTFLKMQIWICTRPLSVLWRAPDLKNSFHSQLNVQERLPGCSVTRLIVINVTV